MAKRWSRCINYAIRPEKPQSLKSSFWIEDWQFKSEINRSNCSLITLKRNSNSRAFEWSDSPLIADMNSCQVESHVRPNWLLMPGVQYPNSLISANRLLVLWSSSILSGNSFSLRKSLSDKSNCTIPSLVSFPNLTWFPSFLSSKRSHCKYFKTTSQAKVLYWIVK